jgi:hypothetical protein
MACWIFNKESYCSAEGLINMTEASCNRHRGIFFISTGKTKQEALKMVKRVKNITEYPIAVASESPELFEECADILIDIDEPKYSFSDKPRHMYRSPFTKTIYLDTDIWIVKGDGLKELFDLLNEFELAVAVDTAHNVEYTSLKVPNSFAKGLPLSFPMINTGVLVFRTKKVERLLKNWKNIHDNLIEIVGEMNDQVAFRRALYFSNVKYATFPEEYNFRVPYPQFYSGSIRILHGRPEDPERLAESLNSDLQKGVSRPGKMYHPIWATDDNLNNYKIDYSTYSVNDGNWRRIISHMIVSIGISKTVFYTVLGAGSPRKGNRLCRNMLNYIENEGTFALVRKIINRITDHG